MAYHVARFETSSSKDEDNLWARSAASLLNLSARVAAGLSSFKCDWCGLVGSLSYGNSYSHGRSDSQGSKERENCEILHLEDSESDGLLMLSRLKEWKL